MDTRATTHGSQEVKMTFNDSKTEMYLTVTIGGDEVRVTLREATLRELRKCVDPEEAKRLIMGELQKVAGDMLLDVDKIIGGYVPPQNAHNPHYQY